MRVKLYHINAFTNELFHGNPAAVCPLSEWLNDKQLQAIAAENNLSETAFFTGQEGRYALRWFTPGIEVDLCGHATLATAYIIFSEYERSRETLQFTTRSGDLFVTRMGDNVFAMDFPAKPPSECKVPVHLTAGLGAEPLEVLMADDYVAVFADETAVRALQPDFKCLQNLSCRGIIATALGDRCDFVSRFFAPNMGIDEDPVTGSTHCTLAPYWATRLGKNLLKARQVSKRGGCMQCEIKADRVILSGECVKYLQGEIEI